jgi:hypothetical protein
MTNEEIFGVLNEAKALIPRLEAMRTSIQSRAPSGMTTASMRGWGVMDSVSNLRAMIDMVEEVLPRLRDN